VDDALEAKYTADTHAEGKRANKMAFQAKMGLEVDPHAALFFWPSRLDPVQKGPQLLTNILYSLVSRYWDRKLQIAVVANGQHQGAFHDVVRMHDFKDRVAVCNFEERLSRLGYAAADFVLVPSLFEPCGLPQMIGAIYGSLPVVHDTGGLHDTVEHLAEDGGRGNGFVFKVYGSAGLEWAMDQAMCFHGLPVDLKQTQIARIMRESKARFNHAVCARAYMDIYETMLKRPLVKPF